MSPRDPTSPPVPGRAPRPPAGPAELVDSHAPRRYNLSLVPTNRPTLSDVAKLSGVTAATVSRVLNNKQKFSASDAVRERIFAAAKHLGYAPDLAARSLNRQKTNIIGVFTSPKTHVAEGIYELLFEGISEVLQASEYDVFFNLGAAHRHALPFWRFDGAVLLQSPPPDIVEELERRRVRYVCVNEKVGSPVAHVIADDRTGMRRAVEHLHQLGHRRIGYANARATYLTHYSVTERYETLMATVRELGMELARGHDVPFCSAGEFLRDTVLGEKATAVITYDHQIATMLVGAAHTMSGLRIPQDFSLICFNDIFPVANLPPPLTAVAVSGREMGRLGAGLLLNSLVAAKPAPTKEVKVPEELVVRQSTAPPGGGAGTRKAAGKGEDHGTHAGATS